jgi:chromosome segregation ATPase
MCTNFVSKIFPMRTVQLEPVEGASKGIDERLVDLGEENENVQELSQQLKQAQHVITQCYQESRELRRHMSENTIEMPTLQSRAGQLPPTSPTTREGNVNWLKKHLQEAQDVIIELREEQRMPEEKIIEHFKEYIPSIDYSCASLASA